MDKRADLRNPPHSTRRAPAAHAAVVLPTSPFPEWGRGAERVINGVNADSAPYQLRIAIKLGSELAPGPGKALVHRAGGNSPLFPMGRGGAHPRQLRGLDPRRVARAHRCALLRQGGRAPGQGKAPPQLRETTDDAWAMTRRTNSYQAVRFRL